MWIDFSNRYFCFVDNRDKIDIIKRRNLRTRWKL